MPAEKRQRVVDEDEEESLYPSADAYANWSFAQALVREKNSTEKEKEMAAMTESFEAQYKAQAAFITVKSKGYARIYDLLNDVGREEWILTVRLPNTAGKRADWIQSDEFEDFFECMCKAEREEERTFYFYPAKIGRDNLKELLMDDE
jgi:hypothetical protein